MKIYTATDDFYNSVCELFAEHGDVKILPTNLSEYRNLDIDLLIFTGGEDVNPERYGQSNKIIRYNEGRDKLEFSLLHNIILGRTKVKKILGICRGMQVINVAMCGSLIQDIYTRFGVEHEQVHPLNWLKESPMSILTETNSLHHQGIMELGYKIRPQVLAVEPITKVSEVVMWENDYLGIQFHPEFFPDSPIKRDLAQIIASWCMGNLKICDTKELSKTSKHDMHTLQENFVYQPTMAGSWSTSFGSMPLNVSVEENNEDDDLNYVPESDEEEEEE